ncbi:MAG: hypothetical protein K2Y23_05115 [Cyanobacteria bacterium]|nr:hypothetical protein [Cyanobacteriota bacterium]
MIRFAPGLIASLFVLNASSALAQPASPSVALAKEGPFKIVVLAGEDSVNVIQQKTAVAPLIEVRDRNNVPVPGAMVTFAVQGGKAAAFQGGASTLTIATNAAGQAAATGFTPMTAGAVNISVSATVQGQVVTAAISQVNVLTAAEAAAAASGAGAGSGAGGGAGSGAGASGGAAGGGGLSATTLGIVGGIAAAGAVAGTQVLGGRPDTYTGMFALVPVMTFGTCTRQTRYSGTLVVEIDSSDGSVTGSASIESAREEFVSTTCPGQPPSLSNQWGMPDATVRGSESALSFEAADSVPAGDGSGPINRNYKFSGALSGTTITGTFELTWIHQVVAGARFTERQTVTLQKR